MPNSINLSQSRLHNVSALLGDVVISPTFDISAYRLAVLDMFTRNALPTFDGMSLSVNFQQSNDGVLWETALALIFIFLDNLFTARRSQVQITPGRKFGRVVFTASGTDPANFNYTVMGKTNV